jgi:hypothetical protein
MRPRARAAKLRRIVTTNSRRNPMSLPTPLLAAVCAAGVLVVPAAASAAPTVVAGPLKVKDYEMTVMGTHGSPSLSVLFNRTSGKASQLHSYSFAAGATVKVKGKKASIKADLGAYGAVNLKVKKLGAARKGVAPKGCTGTAGKSRTGTLKGSFRLVADSSYFSTVSAKKLKAQVLKSGSLRCDSTGGGDPAKRPTTLTATLDGPAGMLMFSASKDADGSVAQTAMRMDDEAATAPATITHLISAPGGAAAFSPAGDLTAATGTGVSPFFSGAFSFAGEAMGTMSMGTLSGDLAARFDSIGTQAIAASSPDAMLMPPQ